jgi:Fur family transcriptional regulator, ferric uptake regulator
MTLPRQVIITVLNDASGYLSAEDVFMQVHDVYPGIGLATVYRTLQLLDKMGIVTKFEFGDGKARYELVTDEQKHYHLLICDSCFKVVKYDDFSEQERRLYQKVKESLEESHNYRIHRHVIQYYGLCEDCSAKNGEYPRYE